MAGKSGKPVETAICEWLCFNALPTVTEPAADYLNLKSHSQKRGMTSLAMTGSTLLKTGLKNHSDARMGSRTVAVPISVAVVAWLFTVDGVVMGRKVASSTGKFCIATVAVHMID